MAIEIRNTERKSWGWEAEVIHNGVSTTMIFNHQPTVEEVTIGFIEFIGGVL